MIVFYALLLLLPVNTILFIKMQNNIDTMIVSLLQSNLILRYLRNCGHLGFLLHYDLLYYNYGEFIQGQILFTPILKSHQEHLFNIYYLDHTIQLLPYPYWKYFPYLLFQLTYICLKYRPHHNIAPPPLNFRCMGWEEREEALKIEVLMVCLAYHRWGSQSVSSIWLLFRFLEQTKLKT